MAWNKKDVLRLLKNILLCVFGNILLAFATAVFFYEFNIITGGISGMAIILNSLYSFGQDSSAGEVIWTFIITWFFYIVGAIGLGKKFALKTLVSTITVPLDDDIPAYAFASVG